MSICSYFFFFQAEDGIRDLVRSRGLGDVYKRQYQRRVRGQIRQTNMDRLGHRVGTVLILSGAVREVRNGFHVVEHEDGTRYEGEYVNGQRTGHGTLSVPDQGVFDGEFLQGKANGSGTFTWRDGGSLNGQFVNGQPEGRCVYQWEDGRVQEAFVNCHYNGIDHNDFW
eukprot:TRINITY_DN1555_c0_g1_i4.p1 TRINITY_DN1555_c0_g1~~TRINITY_DN1555_c0_g1_i4.p1  ORF type:complete len:168 (+),score=30.89 TRINITY_DN1555_c0_g1_i4:43-546(+)